VVVGDEDRHRPGRLRDDELDNPTRLLELDEAIL
jgi:hypothetical protein